MIVTLLSHPSLLSLDSGANDLEISDFSSDTQTRHGHHFMLLPGTAAGALGHIMAPGCVPPLRLSVRTAQTLKYQRLQETAWTLLFVFFAPYKTQKEKCIMLKNIKSIWRRKTFTVQKKTFCRCRKTS